MKSAEAIQTALDLPVDLKHRKIRVNVISPGPIDTPIFSAAGKGEVTNIKHDVINNLRFRSVISE